MFTLISLTGKPQSDSSSPLFLTPIWIIRYRVSALAFAGARRCFIMKGARDERVKGELFRQGSWHSRKLWVGLVERNNRGEAVVLFCIVFVLRSSSQRSQDLLLGGRKWELRKSAEHSHGDHGRAGGAWYKTSAFDRESSHAAGLRLPGGFMGEAGVQRGTGEGRLSWPVILLTLTAIVSSSISALSLYQLLSLRAEVDAIKSEVWRRREGQAANRGNQVRVTGSLSNTK